MSKSPNTDAQVIDAVVGTTETQIAHNLGRVALDGFIIRQTKAGSIWRGATAWDGTNIFLVATTTDTSIRFYVF